MEVPTVLVILVRWQAGLYDCAMQYARSRKLAEHQKCKLELRRNAIFVLFFYTIRAQKETANTPTKCGTQHHLIFLISDSKCTGSYLCTLLKRREGEKKKEGGRRNSSFFPRLLRNQCTWTAGYPVRSVSKHTHSTYHPSRRNIRILSWQATAWICRPSIVCVSTCLVFRPSSILPSVPWHVPMLSGVTFIMLWCYVHPVQPCTSCPDRTVRPHNECYNKQQECFINIILGGFILWHTSVIIPSVFLFRGDSVMGLVLACVVFGCWFLAYFRR